jgi:hypothetical protein
MPKTVTIRDSNYVKGMNTVDDPKVLQDGECVELVNAYPAYPLKHRKGCKARSMLGVGGAEGSKVFVWNADYVGAGGNIEHRDYLFFWAKPSEIREARHEDYRDGGWTHGGMGEYTHEELRYVGAAPLPGNNEWGGSRILYYVELGDRSVVIPKPLTYRDRARRFADIQQPCATAVCSFAAVDDVLYVTTEHMIIAVTHDADGLYGYLVPTNGMRWFTGSPLVIDNNQSAGNNNAFGYAVTLVRRELDSDRGNAVKTYTPGLIETPEIPAMRAAIFGSHPSGHTITIYRPGLSEEAVARNYYDYTHWRLYRTMDVGAAVTEDGGPALSPAYSQEEKEKIVKGADMFFLADIPIDTESWQDTISPDALDGEMNQLTAFNYTFPPKPGRAFYHKGRLFIGDDDGRVFYSEALGLDGGTDLAIAQEAQEKYAVWFKPLYYRLELERAGGLGVSGFGAINDDLYIFTESAVYMIPGGDPTRAPLVCVEDKYGCAFPDSVVRFKSGGDEMLFYLSDYAPMAVTRGGYVGRFDKLKLCELYRSENGELALSKNTETEYCTAANWDGCLWLFFKAAGGVDKVYGFQFDGGAEGAFRFEVNGNNGEYVYPIRAIAVGDDNKACAVTIDKSGYNLLVGYCEDLSGVDSGARGGKMHPIMRLTSRKLYPGPEERNISELLRAVTYTDFEDHLSPDVDRFVFCVFNNRYRAELDYLLDGVDVNNVWESSLPVAEGKDAKEEIRRSIAFIPMADMTGEYFQYSMERSVPSGLPDDGHFSWYGVTLEAVGRPNMDNENWAGGMPVTFAGGKLPGKPTRPSAPTVEFWIVEDSPEWRLAWESEGGNYAYIGRIGRVGLRGTARVKVAGKYTLTVSGLGGSAVASVTVQ